ncbi:transposase [Beggiatoa sp. PS]|nr:transposase [Beggiatoa sp. PS]
MIETEPKPRGKPPFSVDDSLIPHIRHYVRSMNQTGQYLSVRRIRSWLIQEPKTDIPIMTLFRFLARIEIVYGTGKRSPSLKESDKIIISRREYLKKKNKNRRKNGTKKRPEVYLDETYINQNISNDKTSYLETEDSWVNKPSGKGPRLIIVNAITSPWWVNGAKLVFQARGVARGCGMQNRHPCLFCPGPASPQIISSGSSGVHDFLPLSVKPLNSPP